MEFTENNQGIELRFEDRELIMSIDGVDVEIEFLDSSCRRVYRYKDHVIKIDVTQSFQQSKMEVEFYFNDLDEEDEEFFLEPTAWGEISSEGWGEIGRNNCSCDACVKARGEVTASGNPKFYTMQWVRQDYVKIRHEEHGGDIHPDIEKLMNKYEMNDIYSDKNWGFVEGVPLVYDSYSN